MEEHSKPTFWEAIMPIIVLVGLLYYNVVIYSDEALGGANQFVLILAAGIAAIIGMRRGYTWDDLLKGIVNSIKAALPAILILLMIGSLAGTWLISGIVPAMIYYGLQIINPNIFLVAACIVCAIVSLASGSSWSTVATVGIALLGIGKALGFSDGLIAGAIISGAYFGDKMSPLSDTTNLAPAMAGTDLFTHIRYMTITTFPSFTIALVIFLIIGLNYETQATIQGIEGLLTAIQGQFNINLLLFIVPALVIYMIVRKVSPIPALLIGSLLGGLFAIIFQPQVIQTLGTSGAGYGKASYVTVMNAMTRDVSITTDNEILNSLLSTSGMAGMLNTVWLILCAMSFGGVMEASGLLQRITEELLKLARSVGALFATTALSSMFFNATASDQYLAIVVPGRMFAKAYRDRGLAPENLSRTLEDAGTVTSVLVPWNTCGAVQASVLGVATLTYAPYAFFNIISPIMTILIGFIGFRIAKLSPQDAKEGEMSTSSESEAATSL